MNPADLDLHCTLFSKEGIECGKNYRHSAVIRLNTVIMYVH